MCAYSHTINILGTLINTIGKLCFRLRASKESVLKKNHFLPFSVDKFNFELLYLTSKFILVLIQSATPDPIDLETYSILSLTS